MRSLKIMLDANRPSQWKDLRSRLVPFRGLLASRGQRDSVSGD